MKQTIYNTSPTIKLRAALREKYGPRCYRITRGGDVHVYGKMPNSDIVGWWFMGDILIAELWMGV